MTRDGGRRGTDREEAVSDREELRDRLGEGVRPSRPSAEKRPRASDELSLGLLR